jgi:DNA-binding protein H-NS
MQSVHMAETKASGGIMDYDLNELSLQELKSLRRKVDAAVAGYEERRLREARAELEAKAKELGFTLAEVVGVEGKAKVARKPAEAKYRHCENHALTWSGRGRKPAWFDQAELIPES